MKEKEFVYKRKDIHGAGGVALPVMAKDNAAEFLLPRQRRHNSCRSRFMRFSRGGGEGFPARPVIRICGSPSTYANGGGYGVNTSRIMEGEPLLRKHG